jgi:glycosyltransferase involved in cell wall biosynthesis
MKILFAIKTIDDIAGGAERVLADISAGLLEKGHDIALLSFDKPGGKPFYSLHKNMRRISLGIGRTREPSGLLETMRRMGPIRRAILNEKPDVVIAFMHSMFIPVAFAMIGTGIPVIASEHIVPDHYKNRRLEFFLLILSGLIVKRITVMSNRIRNMYPRILRKRMVILPNPVHLAAIVPDAEKNSAQKIILNVGRLTYQKDQQTLIAAFAQLAPKFPDWTMRIVGKGELEGDLRKQILDLGMETRIVLPGITQAIEAEYTVAGIFALPSRYESFGLVTVEAMSHGLPVIGFADCPGTNELIDHGKNGLLVDGLDRVKALASGLEILMDDRALRTRLGREGIKTASQFAPEKIIAKWEDLIRGCADI